MTLIKPAGLADMSQVAGMSFEQQILGELRSVNDSITQLQHGQELMNNELLGREGAREHGRLPRVEKQVEDLEKEFGPRIESLEDDRIRWKAYAVAAAGIGSLVGSVIGMALALAGLVKGR